MIVSMRIDEDDKDRLMNDCKELFLKNHPEMDGMNISQRFMLHKVIKFYLG